MEIGIGLPLIRSSVLLKWAARIDEGPFSSIGLADRMVYSNPDVLITLAGAAAVTERVGLITEVLLAPIRGVATLAKQLSTLDELSGGRLTVGMGLGPRPDDYLATGVPWSRRGRILDEQLSAFDRVWNGKPLSEDVGWIGPAPARPGGPKLLLGGFSDVMLERAARRTDGFISSAKPAVAAVQFEAVRRNWESAGRAGSPRLVGQLYVSLGSPDEIEAGRAAVRRYMSFLPADGEALPRVLGGIITTSERLVEEVKQYADVGADELMLYVWSENMEAIDQIEQLVA